MASTRSAFLILCFLSMAKSFGSEHFGDSLLYGDPRGLLGLSSLLKDGEANKLFRSLYPVNHMDKLHAILGNLTVNRSTGSHQHPGDESTAISFNCISQLFAVTKGIIKKKDWALRFLDAWGKPPPGILDNQFKSYGDIQLCRSLNVEEENDMKGKYCMIQLNMTLYNAAGVIEWEFTTDLCGACVPDKCNSKDIKFILKHLLNSTYSYILGDKNLTIRPQPLCQEKKELQPSAIFAITLASSVLYIVILSTVVNWVLRERPRKQKQHDCPVVKSQNETPHIQIKSTIDDQGSVPSEVSEKQKPNPESGVGAKVDDLVHIPKLRKNKFIKLLFCFSLQTNIPSLVKIETKKRDPSSISCLYGIRVLSMIWIIVAHLVLFGGWKALNPVGYFFDHLANQSWGPFVFFSHLGPDTFFTVGGLLCTTGLLQFLDNHGGHLSFITWIKGCLKRYLRLTPCLAILLFLTGFTMEYWGDGPAYNIETSRVCRKYWYRELLFIGNFYKYSCMNWAWYIAVDFQLSIMSPLLILALYRKPVAGGLMLFLASSASIVYTVWNTYLCDMPSFYTIDVQRSNKSVSDNCDLWTNNYTAPWARCNSYFVGILAGYFLYKTNYMYNLRPNKVVLAIGWLVATGTAYGVIFGVQDSIMGRKNGVPMTMQANAAFAALYRPAWSAVVAWVIVVCASGYGGPVNRFLSLPIWQPFAKVTYCVYLSHLPIVLWFYAAQPIAPYLNDLTMAFYIFGHTLVAFLVAFPISLVCEMPFLKLLQPLLSR